MAKAVRGVITAARAELVFTSRRGALAHDLAPRGRGGAGEERPAWPRWLASPRRLVSPPPWACSWPRLPGYFIGLDERIKGARRPTVKPPPQGSPSPLRDDASGRVAQRRERSIGHLGHRRGLSRQPWGCGLVHPHRAKRPPSPSPRSGSTARSTSASERGWRWRPPPRRREDAEPHRLQDV